MNQRWIVEFQQGQPVPADCYILRVLLVEERLESDRATKVYVCLCERKR